MVRRRGSPPGRIDTHSRRASVPHPERTHESHRCQPGRGRVPDGLEELLSPLGFALAAALEGMAVHLYIQGPAVRILTRGFQPKLRGWARPFSPFAAAGLSRAGHVPAKEKLRQLRSLDARLYLFGPSMQRFKVKADDLIFDDIPVVEYLSFIAAMKNATIHIYA